MIKLYIKVREKYACHWSWVQSHLIPEHDSISIEKI